MTVSCLCVPRQASTRTKFSKWVLERGAMRRGNGYSLRGPSFHYPKSASLPFCSLEFYVRCLWAFGKKKFFFSLL